MISFKKVSASLSRARARTLISLGVAMLGLLFASSMLASCGSTTTVQSTPKPLATLILTPQPTLVPTPTPTPTSTPQPPTPTPVPSSQGAPAILDLQPASMSIVGHLDCKRTTVYVCLARVLSRSSNQSNLHWTAFTNVPGHIVFSPASGVLAPGHSVFITISVPFTSCTHGLFYFQGPINTHTITWAC
jgi:hypothetical protein